MSDQPKFQLPWTYQLADEQPEGDLQLFHIVFGNNEGCVASVWGEEQAKRIVACVNACKGISTETLEKVRGNVSASVAQLDDMRKQRDELLAALRSAPMVPWDPSIYVLFEENHIAQIKRGWDTALNAVYYNAQPVIAKVEAES